MKVIKPLNFLTMIKVIATIFESSSWMLNVFSNSEAMFVYKVTLTTSFMKITHKKGRCENIMIYITFYCVKNVYINELYKIII